MPRTARPCDARSSTRLRSWRWEAWGIGESPRGGQRRGGPRPGEQPQDSVSRNARQSAPMWPSSGAGLSRGSRGSRASTPVGRRDDLARSAWKRRQEDSFSESSSEMPWRSACFQNLLWAASSESWEGGRRGRPLAHRSVVYALGALQQVYAYAHRARTQEAISKTHKPKWAQPGQGSATGQETCLASATGPGVSSRTCRGCRRWMQGWVYGRQRSNVPAQPGRGDGLVTALGGVGRPRSGPVPVPARSTAQKVDSGPS